MYFGHLEIQQKDDIIREIHYVNASTGLVAMFIKENNTYNYYYTATDHLGSITTVMDEEGDIVAEQSFDAWGRRRNTSNWSTDSTNVVPTWLYRGYTGHEMLDSFQLINMNGRLYDPVIARMLSPDPFVQAPNSLQNYNRYSYVMNNPLSYTDPSGYQSKFLSFLGKIFNPDQDGSGAGGNLNIPISLSGIAEMITAAWNETENGKNTLFDIAGYFGEKGKGYDIPESSFSLNNKNNSNILFASTNYIGDMFKSPKTHNDGVMSLGLVGGTVIFSGLTPEQLSQFAIIPESSDGTVKDALIVKQNGEYNGVDGFYFKHPTLNEVWFKISMGGEVRVTWGAAESPSYQTKESWPWNKIISTYHVGWRSIELATPRFYRSPFGNFINNKFYPNKP